MMSWWQGPFKVIERLDDNSYKLRTTQGEEFDTHAEQMKPCVWEMRYPSDEGPTIAPPPAGEGDEEEGGDPEAESLSSEEDD